ncbi:MAG TPA: alpha/beta hydrolase fold domain-containing protein [Pyrinomonadaceae bacterium]|nr:alpha/beta hydrolase fold domain-containing protein [Pyrinomonadaceae bacterium]
MKRLFCFLAIVSLSLNFSIVVNKALAQTAPAAQQTLSQSEEEAKRAIEARLSASIEAMRRKDLAARLELVTPNWTGKLKDGEIITVKDLEESFRRQHQSIISVSDETRTVVDTIQLSGNEATVHTSQRFVRTVPGGDGKPVEVRTSVTHLEKWVRTERGWLTKYIEELEQGPTFVGGVEQAQDRVGWKFVRVVWEEGVERARQVFEEARRRDPQAVLFQEGTLNTLGYKLINKGRATDAIEVFRLNTLAYPQAFNAYDSLAEAYMVVGNKQLAIENYRKSLELNPKNTNAVPMLERLGVPLSAEAIWQMAGPPPDVELLTDVEYGSRGSHSLKMHILRPKAQVKGGSPVIVFIHGGGWFEGHHNRGIGPLIHFAERGYLCATIEYRLSDEAKFPAQIEDVKLAIRYLRAKAKELRLDPERIGVWGQSAGGHLAALLGTSGGVKDLEGAGQWQKFSSRVQAVVDWNGPVDFLDPQDVELRAKVKADAPERLLGVPLKENVQRVARANPVTYVSKDDPPFLLMHGDADAVVSFSQSQLLYDALKRAGVDVTLEVVKGAGHFGVDGVSRLQGEFAALMDAFFDKHLKR